MSIIAIDPGPEQSAVVDYDPHRKVVLESRIDDNEAVLKWLRQPPVFKPSTLVIETMHYYGMPVGKPVFTTCIWIGRFIEAWGPGSHLISRPEVMQHLCNSSRAKAGNIRQVLVDKFGGEKACKGPVKITSAQQEALIRISKHNFYKPKVKPGTLRSLENKGFITKDGVMRAITAAGRDALDGKCGALYGMASHKWAALAVAVTWAETRTKIDDSLMNFSIDERAGEGAA